LVRQYSIRYGVLKPTDLSDKVLVKNPAYGDSIGGWGSRDVKPIRPWYNSLEQKNQFYTRLEESLKTEGFRNPIFCNSIPEGTFCRYGTSRLWIAKRLGMPTPCVIADYTERWNHLEELKTEEDIKKKFLDLPTVIELNEDEMRIDACPHTHLEEENG
jgi:hypothetical protein